MFLTLHSWSLNIFCHASFWSQTKFMFLVRFSCSYWKKKCVLKFRPNNSLLLHILDLTHVLPRHFIFFMRMIGINQHSCKSRRLIMTRELSLAAVTEHKVLPTTTIHIYIILIGDSFLHVLSFVLFCCLPFVC